MQFPVGLPGVLDQVCEVIITGFAVIIQQEITQLFTQVVMVMIQQPP